MSEKTSTSSGGIGFTGLLTILFIGLKLTGYIAWSWWWVLSPLWIGLALVLVLAAAAGLAMGGLWVAEKVAERRRTRTPRPSHDTEH